MTRNDRRRALRAPFVVTAAVAVTAAATACGGQAFNDQGGAGHAGSSGGGSAGGAGAAGGVGGGSGGAGGGSCPTTVPGPGTACAIQGQNCTYPNGPCCSPTTATCTNRQWQVAITTCNPPPPIMCPASPPPTGSACGPVYECGGEPVCSYSCVDGSSVTARCMGATWSVTGMCPSYDGGTSACSTQLEKLRAFANANRSCSTSADCTSLYGACSQGADYCDGTFYVNRSTDTATWNALTEELWSCYMQSGVACAVCDGIPPTPTCSGGVCLGFIPL